VVVAAVVVAAVVVAAVVVAAVVVAAVPGHSHLHPLPELLLQERHRRLERFTIITMLNLLHQRLPHQRLYQRLYQRLHQRRHLQNSLG